MWRERVIDRLGGHVACRRDNGVGEEEMKLRWTEIAARVAVQNPHWSWSEVCAHVGRRKRARVVRTVEQYTRRMEQLKLF